MLNPQLAKVPHSCWRKLDDLLGPLEPRRGLEPIKLSVGDPEHAIPSFMMETIHDERTGFGAYAPITGTDALRRSFVDWLRRRYRLPDGMLEIAKHVLPVAGLREAMFLMALVVTPRQKGGNTKPLIAIPNPYYHSYVGAAIAFGAEALLVPATRETGFLPDFARLDEATLRRLAAVYLCTPSNPQGVVADLDYLRRLIELGREFDFVLLVDECYADIYVDEPPVGVLQACARLGGDTHNVLAFHSLSKRSNVPGLRSGFVAGDPDLLAVFKAVRDYGGVAMPLPIQAASTALWNDDEHAEISRKLYIPKFDAAGRIFGNRLGYYRPGGGMFLWLEVGDCEEAARVLWAESAIRVMPGKYMSERVEDGTYPGAGFIRVALVPDLSTTTQALERMSNVL